MDALPQKTIPTVKAEDLSQAFLPDKVGVRMVECYVVENHQRKYYSEIIWSDGQALSSAKLVGADGELPQSLEDGRAIELLLSFNPTAKLTAGTTFGREKYILESTSIFEAQGLVRSFGQSMINGIKFDAAIAGVRGLAERLNLRMFRVDGRVVTVEN